MSFSVPDPFLTTVENQTPFKHLSFDKMGPGRRFYDVIVVRGSFDLYANRVSLAREQTLPVLADAWWDEENAELSSLKEVGDVLLYKPGTDVFVTGTARTAQQQPATEWRAGVIVMQGDAILLSHILALYGPRFWQHKRLKGWHLSSPTPTHAVPLRYELAYGGTYMKNSKDNVLTLASYRPNPSGTGFFDAASLNTDTRYSGPQIEDPKKPISRINESYPLAGFGPVARFWSDRSRYAGTYDEAWQEQFEFSKRNQLAPDFPPDFDLRFYQCAHPSLICPTFLNGDERIGLGGLLPEATSFVTHLPGIRLQAHILAATASPSKTMPLNMDTVHVDLDTQKIHLSWRLRLPPEYGVRALALDWKQAS